MMKPSTRRMLVAQKRIREDRDVLRRPGTFHKQEVWFWHWWLNTPHNQIDWIWHVEKLLWKVALIGPLPGKRRLTKPLVVDVESTGYPCWFVSESIHNSFVVGPTLHQAMIYFRNRLVDDLDSLAKEEGHLSQCLQDRLAYLREMIYDETK